VIPPDVQEHILGSLEMLFGTPSHPQFMQLKAWVDDGYNPNWPTYAKGDNGSSEISPEVQEQQFWPDNQRAFRRQLASIDAGQSTRWSARQRARAVRQVERVAGRHGARISATPNSSSRRARRSCSGIRPCATRPRCTASSACTATDPRAAATADRQVPSPAPARLPLGRVQVHSCQPHGAAPRGPGAHPRRGRHRHRDAFLPPLLEGAALGLADYVRLLSLRGMVERDLALTYSNNESLPAEYVPESYATMWTSGTKPRAS